MPPVTSCEQAVADICSSFFLLLSLSLFSCSLLDALYRKLSFVAYAISSMSLFKLSFTHVHSPSIVVSIFRSILQGRSASASTPSGSRLNTPLAPVMNTTLMTTLWSLVLFNAYAFAISSAILSPLKIERPCVASSTTSPWSNNKSDFEDDDEVGDAEKQCASQYSFTEA